MNRETPENAFLILFLLFFLIKYFAICEYNVVKQKEKVIIYLNIIQFLKDLYSMWRGGMMHKIVAEGQQDTLLVGVI